MTFFYSARIFSGTAMQFPLSSDGSTPTLFRNGVEYVLHIAGQFLIMGHYCAHVLKKTGPITALWQPFG